MRLRPILAATAVLAGTTAVAATAGPPAVVQRLAEHGVVAEVTSTAVSLHNGAVERTWSIDAGVVRTTSLRGAGQRELVDPDGDFWVTVDGVRTTSALNWQLLDATVQQPPARAGQPHADDGAAVLFRYRLLAAALPALELDRLVVLHPGSAVFETHSSLVSLGAPARVTAYALDQVLPHDPTAPAEVDAYSGGSDWRDDYRRISRPDGAFDIEGEVGRFGGAGGYFLVAQRRGGSMSRVGRETVGGRTWVGVDWAHDLFDFGPLQDQPPSYNRLDNPAYPVPVRSRMLRPLETLDLGTSYLGVYQGGAQQAAAVFAHDFAGAAMPAYPRTIGINTFHPWGHGPGMSDANLRKQVDAAAALGVETFMLDDQWQGGSGGESGDWNWDPERFPDSDGDGVPDFVDYLHKKGLQLGLWMSPVEFNGASQAYAQHPDWACAPVGDLTAQVPDDAGLGVWDATNPAFQDYLAGVVHRLATTDDVREFKFDFMAWVDCGTHDYADYEQAFVDLVHRMEADNPGVTFELDETNDQRCWPFESAEIGPSWFDNMHLHGDDTPVAKLLHDVWTAAPWVPTWSLGIGALDDTLHGPYAGAAGVDALMPLALLTHLTFWTDLTKLTPAEAAAAKGWLDWFRGHRNDLGDVVYELTDHDPIDATSWAAWQPWNDDHGYVFAFRQAGPKVAALRLQGLRPATTYRLADARTGAVVATESGADLMANGLTLSLPRASSEVLSVRPR